jgi:hypothetical protein
MDNVVSLPEIALRAAVFLSTGMPTIPPVYQNVVAEYLRHTGRAHEAAAIKAIEEN